MSDPIEKINQAEILICKEEYEKATRDYDYYSDEVARLEDKIRVIEKIKDNKWFMIEMLEEKLDSLTEGLTKDQKEDLL